MATLVLTVVGTLVGGPIGGAIGAAIGSQVDQRLFSPRGAHGPRLSDLTVQGSSYGAELPRLFGTLRVAGSVIWATDLKEHKHKQSAGKGQTVTTYSYSCSFAVALSARPIRDVKRIWADGALLRGMGGDWKSDLGQFRLYLGDEGQGADPLIAAAEGLGTTPAYRGLAYAVFEDLQLADFGNRIPSLSFEVEADAGAVALGAIAASLSDGAITGAGGPLLGGYAAGGDSVRGAIEGLAAALPVSFAEAADGLALVDEATPAIAIAPEDLGSAAGDQRPARIAIERQAEGTLNEGMSLAYRDPALDYQVGAQGARRGAAARRTGTIELPAAVDAATAKTIAEARLAREWAGRTSATLTLPWRRLDCAPGTMLTLAGEGGRWRVTERAFEAMAVTLTARRVPGPAGAVAVANAGRATGAPDLVHGPTLLALLDLPALGGQPSDTPTLLIAAAGPSDGWRRAVLTGSLDGGATWTTIGQTAAPAVIGRTLGILPPGSATLVDRVSALEVELAADAMLLLGSDAVGPGSASANLALVGEELIQFGAAEQIAPRRFRLSALLRGRRGTEWAMAEHAAGERFVLVEPDSLTAWTLPASAIGAEVIVAAQGIGDAEPVEAETVFLGRAQRPPAPVKLVAEPTADGGLAIAWSRRSRAGWPWLDGGDAPLAEEAERYRVTVTRDGGATLARDSGVPATVIAAAELAALGGAGPLRIDVAQLGTVAATLPPATLSIGD